MQISIYQVNIDRDTEHRAFMDTDFLLHFFGSSDVKSELYDKVFSGEVDCNGLEEVFSKFNTDHPDGYRGRSLSVSDIVEISDGDQTDRGFYFCDSIGFKRVAFEPDKAQDISAPELIDVLFIAPRREPKVMYIKPELEEMQRLVGGYIEQIKPFDDEVAIICNEEGKINGLPLNRAVYDESDGKRGEMIDIIAGSFFLVNAPYEAENYQSLTHEMINKYVNRFRYPESFIQINGEFFAVPIMPRSRGVER